MVSSPHILLHLLTPQLLSCLPEWAEHVCSQVDRLASWPFQPCWKWHTKSTKTLYDVLEGKSVWHSIAVFFPRQILMYIKLTEWSWGHVDPKPDFLFHLQRTLAISTQTIYSVPEDTVLDADITLKRECKEELGSDITVSSLRLVYDESQAACWWLWAHSWYTLSFSLRMGHRRSMLQYSVGILKPSHCSWKQGQIQPWETRYQPYLTHLLTPLVTNAKR